MVMNQKALEWWDTNKKLSGRLARWAMFLSEYNLTVKWKRGQEHRNADCLSRQVAVFTVNQGPSNSRDPFVDKTY